MARETSDSDADLGETIDWSERIFTKIRFLQNLTNWAFVVIIWMMGYAIVYVYENNLYSTLVNVIQTLPTATTLYQFLNAFGVLLGLIGVFQLSQVHKLSKILEEWRKELIRNTYIFNFEMLPAVGKTEEQKILNHINSIFADLHYKRTSDNIMFGKEVKGLKSKHVFDVLIKKAETDEDEGSVIIEIKNSQIELEEFKHFISQIKDYGNYIGNLSPIRVILVCNSLSNSVLEYMNRDRSLRRIPIDLIKKEGTGYKVVYTSA